MVTQRSPQIVHRHRQPPCLSLGTAPSRPGGSRRAQLCVMEGVLRDIRDKLLGSEREEAFQASVLAVETGLLKVVIRDFVGDLASKSSAERLKGIGRKGQIKRYA